MSVKQSSRSPKALAPRWPSNGRVYQLRMAWEDGIRAVHCCSPAVARFVRRLDWPSWWVVSVFAPLTARSVAWLEGFVWTMKLGSPGAFVDTNLDSFVRRMTPTLGSRASRVCPPHIFPKRFHHGGAHLGLTAPRVGRRSTSSNTKAGYLWRAFRISVSACWCREASSFNGGSP